MKFVGYLMHFNTAQPILTKLGGDMHRVMGKCIGYIARAARVRNGREKLYCGGIRAGVCICVQRVAARCARSALTRATPGMTASDK